MRPLRRTSARGIQKSIFARGRTGSIGGRLDATRLDSLREASLPAPIHAINLVQLRKPSLYRFYGMLLAPYAILKGARPVWVALGQETFLGSEGFDEIVIIEYPSHHTLLDIFTGRYYEGINGLREHGIQSLGFSIAEQLGADPVDSSGGPSLGRGSHLVVRFGGSEVGQEVFDSVARRVRAFGEPEYVAREVGRLDIFSDPSPTDPAAVEYPNILVFPDSMPEPETVEAVEILSQQAEVKLAVQRFQTLGLAGALGLR